MNINNLCSNWFIIIIINIFIKILSTNFSNITKNSFKWINFYEFLFGINIDQLDIFFWTLSGRQFDSKVFFFGSLKFILRFLLIKIFYKHISECVLGFPTITLNSCFRMDVLSNQRKQCTSLLLFFQITKRTAPGFGISDLPPMSTMPNIQLSSDYYFHHQIIFMKK